MKRSDAEKIINDWLDNSLEITGKTIIDFLEKKIKMLPPEHKKKTNNKQIPISYLNEWEPE